MYSKTQISTVHSVVEMSRISYQQPDLPLSPKKSDIILAKKTVLVGEVVNGGPLPTPPQHIPVCSFDSQNKYRGEVLVAEPTTSQFKGICVDAATIYLYTDFTEFTKRALLQFCH